MSQVMTKQQPASAAPQQNTPEIGKKKLTENTALAKKILAGAIALSLLVIGPAKIKSLYNETADIFRNGTEKEYTVSVYNDIQTSANSASILAGLAEAQLGKTDDVKELGELARDLIKEDDEDDMVEDFLELVQIANTVYSAYEKSVGSDNVSVDAKKAIRSINSARTTVQNDSYWQYAVDYNDARGGFPARLMALISGAGKLPDKLG